MTDFNPGKGWRKLDPYEETHRPSARTLTEHAADGSFVTFWVREEPVPVLPVEPYTVIRATLTHDGVNTDVEAVLVHGAWRLIGSFTTLLTEYVTGFEVLSEPRAVTAKAVLEPVRDRIVNHVKPGFELMPDGSEDPESASYVAGLGFAVSIIKTAIRAIGMNP